MAQQKNETIIEYARRAISWLGENDETYLDGLPTIASVFELFDLISDTYDVSLIDEIYDEIYYNGAYPKPLKKFLKKYPKVNMRTPTKG